MILPISYDNIKMKELTLFPELFDEVKEGMSSTFQDNMKLPIHRWYRYTAGFSASWVAEVIEKEKQEGRAHVLDPFAGSGTVPVECLFHGMDSYGIESNPYVYNIATAKIFWGKVEKNELMDACSKVLQEAREMKITRTEYPELVMKCFPTETLIKLESLKVACLEITDEGIRNFVWFVITSILRSTSPVGTAQWQYIQPNKSKAKVIDPYVAFSQKVYDVAKDIDWGKNHIFHDYKSMIVMEDARDIQSIPENWADLVITSPPYANNYDYADAMRLEMSFWDDISGWKDLQSKVSSKLVRACTQHVSRLRNEVEEMLESHWLMPISDEIHEKYEELKKERELHGGKKNYHLMIVAYFYDLSKVFHSLNRVTADNCKMCFVIGDSAPYGIYIPVEKWLGELALAAGFKEYKFEKLRDRNTKWKNRKHRVPLKEGRLWINK